VSITAQKGEQFHQFHQFQPFQPCLHQKFMCLRIVIGAFFLLRRGGGGEPIDSQTTRTDTLTAAYNPLLSNIFTNRGKSINMHLTSSKMEKSCGDFISERGRSNPVDLLATSNDITSNRKPFNVFWIINRSVRHRAVMQSL